MEFLQLIESMEAEKASVTKLFGGEGIGVRRSPRRSDPRYLGTLLEATRLVQAVFSGRKPTYLLKEALGTADFPNLFGDIIDRQLLGIYSEYLPVYQSYARVATVSDFRTVKRFAMDGSEAVLGAVGQGEEYPESKLTDTVYSYLVGKYGRKTAINWEAMIDDDLDGLKDLPRRYGRAARRSEQKFVTQLYCDANGPIATFYTVGNKNKVNATNAGGNFTAINPPLSVAGLQEALAVFANQLDLDGEPIVIDAVVLVVPPGLEITAQNILKATELWITGDGAGGTANTQVHTANWMRDRVTLAVDPYIPVVASTANGNTSWFLFASVSTGLRPALEIGFLRGHEKPELFMKDSNAIRVGGGAADPMDGDFDLDSIVYKIRHVFGGARMDPKVTVASNGSGA